MKGVLLPWRALKGAVQGRSGLGDEANRAFAAALSLTLGFKLALKPGSTLYRGALAALVGPRRYKCDHVVSRRQKPL